MIRKLQIKFVAMCMVLVTAVLGVVFAAVLVSAKQNIEVISHQVLERVIADAKAQGRKGCVLTCKDKLVHYYERFGFVNEGVSQSTHGGVVWHDMRLTF